MNLLVIDCKRSGAGFRHKVMKVYPKGGLKPRNICSVKFDTIIPKEWVEAFRTDHVAFLASLTPQESA